MEITGKIIKVLPEQEGIGRNGNPWKVQPYVLETQEQYPRKVHFEVFGADRIQNNTCMDDDIVKVQFDIESREFNGRWYTTVRAWKVEVIGDGTRNQEQQAASDFAPVNETATVQASEQVQDVEFEEDNNDLPF